MISSRSFWQLEAISSDKTWSKHFKFGQKAKESFSQHVCNQNSMMKIIIVQYLRPVYNCLVRLGREAHDVELNYGDFICFMTDYLQL